MEKGIKHYRRVPGENDFVSPQGRSWRHMFQLDTKEEVEAKFGHMGYKFVWHENGDLTMVSHVPGIKIAENGRKTFYNSLVAGYLEKFDPRNPYGKAVALGDDTLVEESLILDIFQFMHDNSVVYPWKSGDFMLIDNVLCYHSRQPFKGRRKVYASVSDGLKPVLDT